MHTHAGNRLQDRIDSSETFSATSPNNPPSPSCTTQSHSAKEPCKKPYNSTKEPYKFAKESDVRTTEPYFSTNEPYDSTKEPGKSAKETCISAKEREAQVEVESALAKLHEYFIVSAQVAEAAVVEVRVCVCV